VLVPALAGRQGTICCGGRGVNRGMLVAEDYGGGIELQGPFDHHARMDFTTIDSAVEKIFDGKDRAAGFEEDEREHPSDELDADGRERRSRHRGLLNERAKTAVTAGECPRAFGSCGPLPPINIPNQKAASAVFRCQKKLSWPAFRRLRASRNAFSAVLCSCDTRPFVI
jgi:hypothetical protein